MTKKLPLSEEEIRKIVREEVKKIVKETEERLRKEIEELRMAKKTKIKPPVGWPEDEPFPAPSEEEVRKAIKEGEELIRKWTEELRKKFHTPEVF